MNDVYVVEFKAYTDGDIGLDDRFFSDYTSKYFDNDLYEYTNHEYYSYSLRRVFDSQNEAVGFVRNLFGTMWGQEYYIKEVFPSFVEDIVSNFYIKSYGSDFLDGNVEITLSINTVQTEARKIKAIIYEE